MRNNLLVSSIFIFLLCNCSTKQNNTIPSLSLPTNWNNYSIAQKDNMPQQWWLQFNDPILNNLIEESLIGNSDIELAMSNVLAAKAQLNLVNSYRSRKSIYKAEQIEQKIARKQKHRTSRNSLIILG